MNELFNPKSLAIIGASSTDGKIGKVILDNAKEYKGKIYPINPNYKEINGIRCYKSILDVKENVEYAIICVPKEHVKSAVLECAKKGVNYVQIISAGFSEIGNVAEENELVKNAKKTRIIGPNTLGIYDAVSHLDTLFIPKSNLKRPARGEVSIISQSGTVGSVLLSEFEKEGIGVSKFISYGNAADLDESDFLSTLNEDKNTKRIVMYIENIKNGEKFLKQIKEMKKEVMILKAGTSKIGQKSSESHTGSLASDYNVYRGIFNQYKINYTNNISDLISFAKIKNLKEPKKAISITNGGGYGILIADICESINLELVEIKNKSKLLKIMPDITTIRNPLDIIGDADEIRFIKAIDTIKSEADTIIISIFGQSPRLNPKSIQNICKYIKENKINAIFICTNPQFEHIIRKDFTVFRFPNELKVLKN